MTTIAWDGKTLAADTRGTAGGMPWQTIKASRLKDGRLYGGSGALEDVEAVRTWLETGGDKPAVKDFVAILIEDGQCFRLEDKLIKMPVKSPFHAIGSGRDYAIAAMHLGKTAREAVELACLYDVYTAAPVTELRETQGIQIASSERIRIVGNVVSTTDC